MEKSRAESGPSAVKRVAADELAQDRRRRDFVLDVRLYKVVQKIANMQHFELSLEEEINIYTHSGLTPTELFVLRLLFLAIDGNQKLLYNYLSNVSNGKTLLRQTLESLQNKKVINSTFIIPKEGEPLNLKNIPFNKNFLKNYIRESNEIGKELFAT